MDYWTDKDIKSWTLYSRSHGLMDSLGLYDTTKKVDPQLKLNHRSYNKEVQPRAPALQCLDAMFVRAVT